MLQMLTNFRCSFVQTKLNWTPHKGTCVAVYLPAYAEDQWEATFFSFLYAMKFDTNSCKGKDSFTARNHGPGSK